MPPKVEPEDFQPCFRCGIAALRVSYWNDEAGGARDVLVVKSFVYDFKQRDARGRLVVHEVERLAGFEHAKVCLNPEPPAEEEYKPWRGARGKR